MKVKPLQYSNVKLINLTIIGCQYTYMCLFYMYYTFKIVYRRSEFPLQWRAPVLDV